MTITIPVACALLAAAGLRLFLGTPKRRARARSALRAFGATLMTRSDPAQRYAGRAGEPAEERSYDAACEELHQDEARKARERHPVRRLSARWKPVPCEPPGEPLTTDEAIALARLQWSIRNETAEDRCQP